MSNTSPLKSEELKQFTGDLERYRHPLSPSVIYTPGVRYLAERGNAYWLLDAIVSHLMSEAVKQAIADDQRLQYLQFWQLKVKKDRSAVLTARADSGVKPFVRQVIPYTDFPLEHVDVWVGYEPNHWTLYLPSEH